MSEISINKNVFISSPDMKDIHYAPSLLNKDAIGDTFENSTSEVSNQTKKHGKFNKILDKLFKYKPECTDGNDDGKLSLKEKFMSVARGTVNLFSNFIDSFIEHPLKSTAGLLAIFGASSLLVGLGIVSAPVLAIAGGVIGIGFGAFNIVKGIHNAKLANNDTDAKYAYENIGEGTSTVALSALLTAKNVKAVKEIKEITSSAKKILSKISSNADKTAENISIAKKNLSAIERVHGEILSKEETASEILQGTKACVKDGALDLSTEINAETKSSQIIHNAASESSAVVKKAQSTFKEAKEVSEKVSETAKKAKMTFLKTKKTSSVKAAKKYIEVLEQSAQQVEEGSKTVTLKSYEIDKLSGNIRELEQTVNSQIKNISKAQESVSDKITRFYDSADDGVIAIDGYGADVREEIRMHILDRCALNDENHQIKNLDVKTVPDSSYSVDQLPKTSKYYKMGVQKTNKKDNSKFFLFENLKQAPDANGVRGKTPLSGDPKKLKWRLGKAKEAGIKRVIDLRSEGECSLKARSVLDELGIEYTNFPVEDSNWTPESLHKITEFINAINQGDYYVGCANGQARTDTAIAINYVLNAKAQNLPEFYYGTLSSSRVSVKQNLLMILDLVKNNKDIVKEWGWESYETFFSVVSEKFSRVIASLS